MGSRGSSTVVEGLVVVVAVVVDDCCGADLTGGGGATRLPGDAAVALQAKLNIDSKIYDFKQYMVRHTGDTHFINGIYVTL